MNLEVDNETPFDAYLIQTDIMWDQTEAQSSNPYITWLRFDGRCDDQYWHDNITSSPFTGEGPPYADPSPPGRNSDCLDSEMFIPKFNHPTWPTGYDDHDWDAQLAVPGFFIGQVCVTLTFQFPEASNQECSVNDCVTLSLNTPTTTPTNTPRPPTSTPDPSWTNTPTRTPTSPSSATNTPTSPAAATNTPTSPPAATNTPTSPPAATNTPVPPPTNTPEPTEIE
jgi:hypothetical protein